MVRNIPYEVFSEWPLPNYVDPVTQGLGALIVNVIFMAVTVPLVSLRVCSRWNLRGWLDYDDYFCVLACFFAMCLSIATIIANFVYGCNRHIYDIPAAWITVDLKIIMSTKALFTCAGTAIRQSLLCLYLRLVHDTSMNRFRWAIHCGTFVNASIGVAFLCLTVFQCTPVSAYWAWPPSPGARCLDEGVTTLICGILVTILDFAVLMLPIPIVLQLQMSKREKFGVILLLNLGMVAVILAIVRTWYIWKATLGSYDESWYAYPLWMIAVLETDLAIICSCAPAIRPFIIQHAPWLIKPFKILGTALSGSSQNSDQPSGRKSRQSGPSSRFNHSHRTCSTGVTAITSSASRQPDKVANRNAEENSPFEKASIIDHGDRLSVGENEVTAGDSKRRNSRPSVASIQDPTHQFNTGTPSKGSRLKDIITSPFGGRNASSSRSESVCNSSSQNRLYRERHLWSYDDSDEDVRLAMDQIPQFRSRVSRSGELSSPIPPARSEFKSASPMAMRIYKEQSDDMKIIPAVAPEESVAMQSSLVGPWISASNVAAAKQPPRQNLESSNLVQPQGLDQHTEQGCGSQMVARHVVRSYGVPSIWDVKRREWFQNGSNRKEDERQKRVGTAQTRSKGTHIIHQLSQPSSRTLDPVVALRHGDPLEECDRVGHIFDGASLSDVIPDPWRAFQRPSAATRAMLAQIAKDCAESSIGSFFDDASEESIEHPSDLPARNGQRHRQL